MGDFLHSIASVLLTGFCYDHEKMFPNIVQVLFNHICELLMSTSENEN